MTWWEYVTQIGGVNQTATAIKLGVSTATANRWQKTAPKPESGTAFACAYNRPILEAFVAAGFLIAKEANEQPSVAPPLTSLDDKELPDEVARRMRGGESHDIGTPDPSLHADDAEIIEVFPPGPVPDWARDEATYTSKRPKGETYGNQDRGSGEE